MGSNSVAVAPVLTASPWWKLLAPIESKVPFFGSVFFILWRCLAVFCFLSLEARSAVVFAWMVIWKKTQQTICKDRGKIISSAEPSKAWQQTPISLSWDIWVANSAQRLVSTNVWLTKIVGFIWKQKVTEFSPELWGNKIMIVCYLLSTLSAFTWILDMLINDME